MRSVALPLLALGACATSVPEGPGATGPYIARGQEPGWLVRMVDGRIDYTGDYGQVRIVAPAGAARTTFNGYRYETGNGRDRLIVDISHGRCNDVMSGLGYADQVLVIANGRSFRGCGGERRPAWDN